MAMILGKKARLTLDEPEDMAKICHALSSPVRVKIMRLLDRESKSVGEIAEEWICRCLQRRWPYRCCKRQG